MNLIVAVDSNWAIGSKNELLIRIPNDHKHFREETTGKVVVLGRKTLETFPQGMPLKNRTNIILSKDPNYQVKDAIVDYFREKTGERPGVRVNKPDVLLNIHIAETKCTLSLDSSGESLHRRGYRQEAVEAPLNEVIGWL